MLQLQARHEELQTSSVLTHVCSRLKGHLGMRVSATPLTPELMHMPHNFAQSIGITVVAAKAVLCQACAMP